MKVPAGTQIYEEDGETLLADLTDVGQTVVLAKGGNGGFGNAHFKTSTNQAPRHANPGLPGEERTIRLRLKLIADAGIVGLPNAGKSTFLATVSAAKPKIADYPFTTLIPNLGVVSADDNETFVVADIPGLIEGAHEGHGLGDRFLRHVERCSVIVHLVDLSMSEMPDSDAEVIARELASYSPMLAEKPRIICGSKIDSAIPGNSEKLRAYATRHGYDYFEISAVIGEGVRPLVRALARVVREQRKAQRDLAASAS